ncbi:putative macrolide phosphotransferase k [Byssothecium circinans]|uniref:Putative macrolide phosphotransferase k n=1 Tax=Byssothecium circinans TaxID=147558 RepID=A0A6A5TBR4_9PLEO|nr:putative macrolide phosphotransferase k [Byssothecium circinans]
MPVSTEPIRDPKKEHEHKSVRFWLVFASLLLPAFAANLNATILSTVMPSIVEEIHAGERFIWINAAYAIACAAIQPLLGQLSNIFGRRYPMLLSLALFTLGSGISGGANSLSMLVAGRTVQGLGGGGIIMLMEVIICDLLPQRERPKYLGIVLGVMTLGVLLGPSLGGVFTKNASWKWAFYVSVPIGGVSLLLAIPLLRLKTPVNTNTRTALARIDFMGNIIFLAATCSMLVGLIMGGQTYPWSSFKVILPIALGAVGWILFGFHQASSFVKEPTMPLRIFSNRTALTGYLLVFISSMLLEWIVYYLPYYFQTLKGSSPLFSSVQVLAFNFFLIPSAAINGLIMGKTGKYKPIHFAGFAFLSIGIGLFTTMDTNTSTVKWVFWELFASYGLGCLINSTLPAIQSSLPEKDVATSTGVHAFLRSIGFVWGFTVPSLVFNGQIGYHRNVVDDLSVRARIVTGGAYANGGSNLLKSLAGVVKDQVTRLYTVSLRDVWYTALGFSVVGFFLVFAEKSLLLRVELQTEFGLEEKKKPAEHAQSSAECDAN